MNDKQIKELANQSVARLHQIRTSLLETEEQEKEAIKSLAKSGGDTPERRLTVERDFLRMRVELYGEQGNVLLRLLNTVNPAIDDAEVLALAKDVNLAAKLREKRPQAGAASQDYANNCSVVPGCVTCYTDGCLTCVINANPGCHNQCPGYSPAGKQENA